MDTKLLIKRLGGGAKVAALCEVTPAAVSQWITNGVPPARLMFLRLAKPEAFVLEANLHPSVVPLRDEIKSESTPISKGMPINKSDSE